MRIRETEHGADIGEHVRLGQIHHQSLDSTGIFGTKHHRTGVDGQRSAQTHNGMSERQHLHTLVRTAKRVFRRIWEKPLKKIKSVAASNQTTGTNYSRTNR